MNDRSGAVHGSRAFVAELLGTIRLAGSTPLQSQIDSRGVVARAAARVALHLDRPGLDALSDAVAVTADLHRQVTLAISEAGPSYVGPGAARTESPDGEPPGKLPALRGEVLETTVAGWLSILYDALRAVDARAIEVLSLRFEGCDDREIATRTDLGLRLVRRILEDMRRAARMAAVG